MAKDLRIRPIGKPKFEEDSQTGFKKITRKFAAEGTKVTKGGLDGTDDGIALFRRVGEPDEEYADHYLVNQQITPGETLDACTLVRQYAQLRETWFNQQSSESGEMKKITRKYAVLKNSNHILKQLGNLKKLGYDSREWSLHPKTGSGLPLDDEPTDSGTAESNADCWDMLPEIVRRTEPKVASYVDGDAAGDIPAEAGPANVSIATTARSAYLLYARAVSVGSVDADAGTATLTVDAAAPWKLGDQIYHDQKGAANLDPTQTIEVDDEFVLLGDPRNGQGIDDPASYRSGDVSLYTEGINNVSIGGTIEINLSNIRAVTASHQSVSAQGEDPYLAYSLEESDRKSNFIELLALQDQVNAVDQVSISSSRTEMGMNLIWLRASASVDTSNPGIDVWTCSWVAPIGSYWKVLSNREKSLSPPSIIGFDHTGVKVFKRGSSSTSAPSVLTYFVVAEQAPFYATSYIKNSGSVTMDAFIVFAEDNSSMRRFSQQFSNAAMYQTTRSLSLAFPTERQRVTGDQDLVDVACVVGSGCGRRAPWLNRMPPKDFVNVGRTLAFYYKDEYMDVDVMDRPLFQGRAIQQAGGHISWDSTVWQTSLISSPSSMKISPIFHHNRNRIWKVEVTYF
jgi:hypothetical protein